MTREELERLSPTELIEIIMRLQERIVSLETQVVDLQECLERLAKPEKTSRNSSAPPSTIYKPNRKPREGAKPRGPKPGHVGHSRTRQTPDVVIECRPTVCSQCGHDLNKVEQAAIGTSQVVDIPPIEPDPSLRSGRWKRIAFLRCVLPVGTNRRRTIRRGWSLSGCLDRR